MLMDIIQYLLSLIQYLYQQNCWLISFICRYIPLKQWAFDDSHSPKYQNSRLMNLLWSLTSVRTGPTGSWSLTTKSVTVRKSARSADVQSVISLTPAPVRVVMHQNRFSTRITVPKDSSCAKSAMPGFTDESRFASVKLRCPHCGNTLVPKRTENISLSINAWTLSAPTICTI